MNIYFLIIFTLLIGDYLLGLTVETANLRALRLDVPEEFADVYDREKYKKSQQYLRENTFFELASSGVFLIITLVFISAGGFNVLDRFARAFKAGEIITGLIFAGTLIALSQVLGIFVAAYHTFVIEEKYGFNRTTVRTFVADFFKKMLLTMFLGGIIFALILWFFGYAGKIAWLYCWVATVLFELFVVFISPVVIMPLFNKFTPLEAGELKNKIEEYARKERFAMQGVYILDGSRRSSKSNAFFAGFGKSRRIALYDTLVKGHTVDELVSILAHEMGHYKKRHILKQIAISIVTTGFMFYLMSLFLNNRLLFDAFKMEHLSIYAGLFFFSFLFTPLQTIISLFSHAFSRKCEYQADAYAARTYGRPQAMIDALKKLSVNNLSNLTPHPWKVFFSYTHPPVLERIRAIKNIHS
jgi:STE24 endopeptidase